MNGRKVGWRFSTGCVPLPLFKKLCCSLFFFFFSPLSPSVFPFPRPLPPLRPSPSRAMAESEGLLVLIERWAKAERRRRGWEASLHGAFPLPRYPSIPSRTSFLNPIKTFPVGVGNKVPLQRLSRYFPVQITSAAHVFAPSVSRVNNFG